MKVEHTPPAPPESAPPLWVRALHWINASAFMTMIASGWQIYRADPFWLPGLPEAMTLGGSLPGALQWHFAAMWLLIGNGVLALAVLIGGGRLRRVYWPVRLAQVGADIRGLLSRFRSRRGPGHGEGGRNHLQKLAYLGVLLLLSIEILSGLAMWKPVQLQAIGAFMGGYEGARRVHFIGMSALAMFVAGHVALALASPRLLLAMLGIGGRRS